MAEVKYGLVEGPDKGREYPAAVTQYFHRLGGKFVYLNNGNVTLAASNTNVWGWARVPKCDAGKNGYKTVSGDKLFVVYGSDEDVFEVPVKEIAASLAASQIGLNFKLVHVGATYALIQKAKVGNTNATTGAVNVIGIDTTNKTVLVRTVAKFRQET